MLLNNIELDVKTKCIEESKTQARIAKELGTSPRIVLQGFGARYDSFPMAIFIVFEQRGHGHDQHVQ